MATLGRAIARFVRYYGSLFIGFTIVVAAIEPLLVFFFDEPISNNGPIDPKFVVGWGIFSAVFAAFARHQWGEVYVAPRIGLSMEAIHSNWLGRFVTGIAFVESMIIGLVMPGGVEVLRSQWHWLPDFYSPGILGLGLILTVVLGVTVQVGDSLEFAWRQRPGHDLGSASRSSRGVPRRTSPIR